MKQKLLLTVITIVALAAMVGNAQTNNQSMSDKSKTLVAYFSATGTTMEAASKLAKLADADLFEIVPEIPYTPADLNWRDKSSRSTLEMQDKSSRQQYDFTGKTVIPFFTSGGSGAGETMKYLRPSAPGANWVDPKNLNYMSENEMKSWINSLK